MILTLTDVARSLASYLKPYFPDVTFAEGPIQQGYIEPYMFLQSRGADIRPMTGKRFLWTIRLDLIYLLDMNQPEMQNLYENAAQLMDILLDTFPYTDGENTGEVRAFDRSWEIQINELHYKFSLKAIVSKEELAELMRRLTLNIRIISQYEEEKEKRRWLFNYLLGSWEIGDEAFATEVKNGN